MKEDPWVLASERVPEAGREVLLDPEESRHVVGALRLGVDDRVVLTDGAGRTAVATITGRRRDEVSVVVDEAPILIQGLPGPVLLMGVLHTKAMDWAVQKAVEIGVSSLIPVLCSRSQGHLERARQRMGHLQRISRQALKQCRRPWAMSIEAPVTLDQVVEGPGGWLADQTGMPLMDQTVRCSDRLMIGPEGGLTPDEVRRLTDRDWTPVRLGPHVLRAETAAVVGAGILMAKGGI